MFYFPSPVSAPALLTQGIRPALSGWLAAGLLLAVSWTGAAAFPDSTGDFAGRGEALKREAGELRRKADGHRTRLEKKSAEERRVLASLNTISRSLSEARQRVKKTRASLKELDADIDRLTEEVKDLDLRISRREKQAARRAVALYKLGSVGDIHLLAGAASLHDFLERRRMLAAVLTADEALLEGLARGKKERENALKDLEARRRRRSFLEETCQGQLTLFIRQDKLKKELLRQIRKEKKLARAAAMEAEAAVRAVSEQIIALNRMPPPALPSGDNKDGVNLKSLRKLPVNGTIVTHFGPRENPELGVSGFQSGIDIRAERGEPVHAVAGGTVIYASWFKGYGNMIIVDHRNHYYSLYAHAEELFKTAGEPVRRDEVIATVGDSGSAFDPILHFEIRHHGAPVDPVAWLKDR